MNNNKPPIKQFNDGEITLNQLRENCGLDKLPDGDCYLKNIEGESLTMDQFRGDAPIKFNAASLNVSLGNKEDLVAICKHENSKLEINKDMIGKLDAAFIQSNAITAIVTRVKKELQWSHHALYEVIDVPKLVNIYFERAMVINEADPFKYAERECLALIEKLKK